MDLAAPPPSRPLRAGVWTTPPPQTLAARLHFAWVGWWAFVLTLLLSPCVVAHSASRPGAETFVRWMRPWARGILRLSGYRLRVTHRAPGPLPTSAVFVANHQNGLDVVTTSAALPVPFAYAAKTELRTWPFVGWVLERTACFFIDRSSPRKAAASLLEAARQLRAGNAVLLFPEGERTWEHALKPFMKGAFRLAIEAGVPVVPVTLAGNVGAMDERRGVARPGVLHVVFGEPIPTDGLRRADAEALGERVRAAIEAELARFA